MNDSVSFAPLLSFAVSFVLPVASVLAVALIRRGVELIETSLHIQQSQADQAELDGEIAKLVGKAETWAGILIAKDVNNLAGRSIEVGSPVIAAAVNSMIKDLPQILKDNGWTPASVARLLVGKIGALQPPAPTPLQQPAPR
jgi:hypothetical protein